MEKFDPQTVEVLNRIGEFCLRQFSRNYKTTEQFLLSLKITSVELISRDKISIKLRRPGLLIGPKGQTIDGLSKFLNMEIKIIEDTDPNIYDHLVPHDWSEF